MRDTIFVVHMEVTFGELLLTFVLPAFVRRTHEPVLSNDYALLHLCIRADSVHILYGYIPYSYRNPFLLTASQLDSINRHTNEFVLKVVIRKRDGCLGVLLCLR